MAVLSLDEPNDCFKILPALRISKQYMSNFLSKSTRLQQLEKRNKLEVNKVKWQRQYREHGKKTVFDGFAA